MFINVRCRKVTFSGGNPNLIRSLKPCVPKPHNQAQMCVYILAIFGVKIVKLVNFVRCGFLWHLFKAKMMDGLVRLKNQLSLEQFFPEAAFSSKSSLLECLL